MSNTTRSTNNSSANGGYDERFVVPLEASRRGAHRARVSPVMAVLPVVAVVGIVVGAIALVYAVFGGLGGSSSDTAAQATPSAATTTAPSASGTPSASGAASTNAPVAGTVDKTLTVAVYNGSGISGLARGASSKLSADGWTLGTVATWSGAQVTETTVYYGTDSQKASAAAVVKLLRHGVTKLSAAKAGTGMTVVIGPDYSPGGMVASSHPTASHSASRSTAAMHSSTRAGAATTPRTAQASSSSAASSTAATSTSATG